jgi:hypothetical protein
LLVSSAGVAIGCVLEIGETWTDFRKWLKARKDTTASEEDRSWHKPMAALGLMLVILGVIGEGVAEGFASIAETALRAHDEKVLGDTIIKSGSAKDSADASAIAAGNAKLASDVAVTKADRAVSSAKQASISAGKAIAEANTFEQGIVSARKEAADAVSRLADAERRLADSTQREAAAEARLSAIKTPRSLIRLKELSEALKPFKGTVFTLNAFMDDESNKFSVVVAKALKDAGLIREQPSNMNIGVPTMSTVFEDGAKAEFVPSCLDTGIGVHVTEKESLAELSSKPFLSLSSTLRAGIVLSNTVGVSISPPDENNVTKGVLDPAPAQESLRICVGRKP